MFHPNTERLIDYWRAARGAGVLPPRTAIDPAGFAALLPQVFMLGRMSSGTYPIRLAGELLTELHGRPVKGLSALGLWARGDRVQLQTALEASRRYGEPIVVLADLRAHGVPEVAAEVMFAPLAGASGEADRFLALCQPIAMLQRLQGRPVVELGVRHIATAGDTREPAPSLRLAAIDGRRIA